MNLKIDFKAIEKSINYLSYWPSYCDENGEFINFEEEDEEEWKAYHHDATHSGYWWDEFVKLFSDRMEEIEDIHIYIQENDNGKGEIYIELSK